VCREVRVSLVLGLPGGWDTRPGRGFSSKAFDLLLYNVA
jgi:hypothetical protein